MITNTPVHSLTPPSVNAEYHRAVSYASPVMNPDTRQCGRGIITCGSSRFAVPSDPETRETMASREEQSPAHQLETQPHRGNHLSTTFLVRSGARAPIPCSIGWYDITYITNDTYDTCEYAPI